jgi:hypothetical protein
MKKSLLLGCVILLIIIGCSKNESTTPNPTPENNTTPPCKPTSSTLIINNDTIKTFSRFDNDGKMVRSVTYYSKSDSIVTYYVYDVDMISSSIRPTDTTHYLYDKYDRLSSKIIKGGSNDGRTDEFFYNESDKIIKTRVWFLINSSLVLADSTTYTWSNGNIVSSVKHYTPTFSNWVTLVQNYTYDDKVNGWRVSVLPPSEFRGWSKNNLIQSTVVNHPELTYTINYLEYNSYGLPTIYSWKSGQIDYKIIQDYQCN